MEEIQKRRMSRSSGDFINAEMVSVYWLTKADIVRNLLPPPLEPSKYPLANAFVGIFPETNWGLPYKESGLFIRAEYNGKPGNYCLGMHLEGEGADLGMASGRESYGFPKKCGKISFEMEEESFFGWSERHSVRNIELKVDFTGKPNSSDAQKILEESSSIDSDEVIAYNFKHFKEPGGVKFDYKPVLTSSVSVYRPEIIKLGEAELELKSSEHDPWGEIKVEKVLGAIYTKGTNSMTTGRIESEVDPKEFLPYSFLKSDWF